MPYTALDNVVSDASPASSAKLTLESLEHWRIRLSRDLSILRDDIQTASALSDKWCGKCTESVQELKQLHAKKQADHDACLRAIAGITRDLQCATVIARDRPPSSAAKQIFLIPRSVGHPETGRLLADVSSFPNAASKQQGSANSRTLSRKVARGSAILVNSPDPLARRLNF